MSAGLASGKPKATNIQTPIPVAEETVYDLRSLKASISVTARYPVRAPAIRVLYLIEKAFYEGSRGKHYNQDAKEKLLSKPLETVIKEVRSKFPTRVAFTLQDLAELLGRDDFNRLRRDYIKGWKASFDPEYTQRRPFLEDVAGLQCYCLVRKSAKWNRPKHHTDKRFGSEMNPAPLYLASLEGDLVVVELSTPALLAFALAGYNEIDPVLYRSRDPNTLALGHALAHQIAKRDVVDNEPCVEDTPGGKPYKHWRVSRLLELGGIPTPHHEWGYARNRKEAGEEAGQVIHTHRLAYYQERALVALYRALEELATNGLFKGTGGLSISLKAGAPEVERFANSRPLCFGTPAQITLEEWLAMFPAKDVAHSDDLIQEAVIYLAS